MADFTTWCPDVDQNQRTVPRMKIAKFGDGYEQRVLDGLNPIDKEFTVNYSGKDQTTLYEMQSYLENTKGGAFPFYDRGLQLTYDVFCDEWTIQWMLARGDGGAYGTLTATFRKANGVALYGALP